METLAFNKVDIPVKGTVIYNKKLGRLQLKVKNEVFNIVYIDTVNAYDKLYSLPRNDKWPAWTEKEFTGSSRPYSVSMYWAPFKEGMKIKANLDRKDMLAITNRQLLESDE